MLIGVGRSVQEEKKARQERRERKAGQSSEAGRRKKKGVMSLEGSGAGEEECREELKKNEGRQMQVGPEGGLALRNQKEAKGT